MSEIAYIDTTYEKMIEERDRLFKALTEEVIVGNENPSDNREQRRKKIKKRCKRKGNRLLKNFGGINYLLFYYSK